LPPVSHHQTLKDIEPATINNVHLQCLKSETSTVHFNIESSSNLVSNTTNTALIVTEQTEEKSSVSHLNSAIEQSSISHLSSAIEQTCIVTATTDEETLAATQDTLMAMMNHLRSSIPSDLPDAASFDARTIQNLLKEMESAEDVLSVLEHRVDSVLSRVNAMLTTADGGEVLVHEE
jgi:hypothetical protein